MPTKNNDAWANFESDVFKDLIGGKKKVVMEEIDPANQVTPSTPNTRSILNLLFAIDVSGSMNGERIATVNNALENIFKELATRDDPNAIIKVGILEFEEQARWVTPQPVPLEDFQFTQIKATQWLTNYGPAFDKLREKLSRSEFMNPQSGEYFAPVILFVTDGEPTDDPMYRNALEKLKNNGWFQQSARYAIAVGPDATSDLVKRTLTEFTGDADNVHYADEGEALCRLIEYIAISASQIQTSMVKTDRGGDSGDSMAKAFKKGNDSSIFDSLV